MPTPPAKRREPCQIGALAVVAVAATALLVVVAGGGSDATAVASRAPDSTSAEAWSGYVGEERAQVALGQRQLVVLKAPSLAERVAAAGGRADDVQERRWTRETLARQRQVIQRLRLQGIVVTPDFTFGRVLNGFSAALDPRAASLLERMPEVQGLYPVRAVYPAAAPARLASADRDAAGLAELALPGLTGRGVTIALLDTGVDRVQPLLAGRIRAGYDLVDGDAFASAEARPGDPTDVESHGTELAGLVVGDGEAVRGVAPAATIVPLRVAGWQRDATGEWAVYGRTDQVIAGLERAVDPNGDGDAHDAARIALVGVVEPFAAFADGPAAEAVTGASALDTLVVVPAGNDGPAGPAYGSISGPGGAPQALAVAAADLRRATARVPVAVRAGLRVLLDRELPLVGTAAPAETMTLDVVPARRRRGPRQRPSAAPPALRDFFAKDGTSRVAGRAAMVAAGTSPGLAVTNAATAGAHAVLLYGGGAPAGALGLDEDLAVPVVELPREAARRALRSAHQGVAVTASIGSAETTAHSPDGRIADFSSRGLAFDGRVKPEVAAPGVALPTAEPGTHEDGTPRLGTVNGSSAAAAAVAGAAALLAEARPGLDAAALKALLVGTARPLAGVPPTAQGTGLVDVGAAAASEVAVAPASVAFEGRGRRSAPETLVIRNVSTRPVRVRIAPLGGGAVSVTASPRSVRIPTRGTVDVRLTARVRRSRARAHAIGSLRVVPETGMPQRVLWAAAGEVRPPALGRLVLRAGDESPEPSRVVAFEPSDAAPAVLSFRVGRVLASGGRLELQPVSRLDLRLLTKDGDDLGLLARLRDLLPGWYAFGLTGRGPGGNVLPKREYRLRVVAVPTVDGKPTRRTLTFRIR